MDSGYCHIFICLTSNFSLIYSSFLFLPSFYLAPYYFCYFRSCYAALLNIRFYPFIIILTLYFLLHHNFHTNPINLPFYSILCRTTYLCLFYTFFVCTLSRQICQILPISSYLTFSLRQVRLHFISYIVILHTCSPIIINYYST